MFVFPRTVKWRCRGVFFRRVHGVQSIKKCDCQWTVTKFNGATIVIPDTGRTELLVGREVKWVDQ